MRRLQVPWPADPDRAILLGGIAAAVLSRLLFWLYTGRIWEDAMMAMPSARNLWAGIGLTHHGSEPYVHSFTSPVHIGMMIIGEAFGQGLLALRLFALPASVATVYFAYSIGKLLDFHRAALVLVLGYLALDHFQIFFGMGGMETQVATAFLFANAYYFLAGKWRQLGYVLGFAVLCRPEFMLWGALVGATLLLWHRKEIVPVAIRAAAVVMPWLAFATWYYGSPIPHSLAVKAEVFSPKLRYQTADVVLNYLAQWWRNIAPFYQHLFTVSAPVPDAVLKLVVATLLIVATIGAVSSIKARPRMAALVLLLCGFVIYRTAYTLNPYFMWYLPPYMAICFLLAGAGVTWLSGKNEATAIAVSAFLLVAYAVHFPFTLPLDREVQTKIEDGVRSKTGKMLNALMGPSDTVLLEPLGLMGWELKNKLIYDVPGIASPKALAAFRKSPSIWGMIRELKPDYVVLRPNELVATVEHTPEFMSDYQHVFSVDLDEATKLARWGFRYKEVDGHFYAFRRVRPEGG